MSLSRLTIGFILFSIVLSQYYPNMNHVSTHVADTYFMSDNYQDSESALIDMLLKKNLTNRPRPLNDYFKAIEINVTYNVIQILAFAQAEEILSISSWFTIEWTDERLVWDSNSYDGITQIFLPAKYLWLPDIGLMNGRSNTNFDFSTEENLSRVKIHNNGTVTWMYGVILDVTCRLDVAYFPFDTQICYLILTPWHSSYHHLKMRSVVKGSTVDNSFLPNANISEWSIEGVKFKYDNYTSGFNEVYQYISVGIKLKRQPLYFVILVIVPFSMLSMLASLIFVLDNTGDRLAVAVSLVLSMTMYVVIVSSSAPRSMRNLPVLCIYLLNQLGLLSVATVLAVTNQKLKQGYLDRLSEMKNFRLLTHKTDKTDLELEELFQTSNPRIQHTFDDRERSTSHRPVPLNSYVPFIKTRSYPRTAISYVNKLNHFVEHAESSDDQTKRMTESSFSQGSDEEENYQQQNTKESFSAFYKGKTMSTSIQNDFPSQKRKGKIYDSNMSYTNRNAKEIIANHRRKIIQRSKTLNEEPEDLFPAYLRKFHNLGSKMDKFELIIYLIVSIMNAFICLIVIPYSAPVREITHRNDAMDN